RTFRHGPGDRVSAVRNLFGGDGHFIIYGGVGCEHGGARPDYKSPFRANFDAVVSLVMRDISRVLIKTSPAGNDRAGKTRQIFGRVKAALVREAQSPAGI